MFSFHKPKVYRSTQGCCICKAKSSSSRFTDSKRYEHDFIECFQLTSPRKGEICNACVLLVKRFKRLPPGSERHWGHVVDARIGPGMKSMTKFKKRTGEQSGDPACVADPALRTIKSSITTKPIARSLASVPEKFCKIFRKNKKKNLLIDNDELNKKLLMKKLKEEFDNYDGSQANHNENINDLLCDDVILDSPQSPLSQNNSDDNDDYAHRNIIKHNEINRNFIETILSVHENKINYQTTTTIHKKVSRKNLRPIKNNGVKKFDIFTSSTIDLNLWTKIKTCCGYVFESNIANAVIIDCDLFKICAFHKANNLLLSTNKNILFNNEKENLMGNNINPKIKITDNVNVPTTAVKKHHLYSKRQTIIDHVNRNELYKTDNNAMGSAQLMPTSTSTAVQNDTKNIPNVFTTQPPRIISSQHGIVPNVVNNIKFNQNTINYLHKIKSDSKVIKNSSIDKILPAKLKTTDYNLVKNLVKICTEKSTKNILNNNGENGIATPDVLGNKFSDNSSDSGYEEAPLEHVNLTQRFKGNSGVRSMVLANGIKVHVQPQNLVRAANWVGVPQTTMATLQQQTENTNFNNPTSSNPRDIIVVQQKPMEILIPNSSNNVSNIINDQQKTSTVSNLNQNIVVIKPKYLQQTAK